MLTRLAIRNVVLVEALDLDFPAGLVVLTGETGAGKSILLDALGLALGARAASGLVRAGADQAVVTACFDLEASIVPALAEGLADQGLDLVKGEPLMIRRVVRADGGSRAFLNDQPVSGALLRELGARLVEIHGQHDDRGLLAPAGHRLLLDGFAGLDPGPMAQCWAQWQAIAEQRADTERMLAQAEAEREWLTHAVAEITALAPEAGEEELLAIRRQQMQRGQKLGGELNGLAEMLGDADGPAARMRTIARTLERLAGDDGALGEALAALDRALIETGVAEDRILASLGALAFDPVQLDRDEERLFALRAMARKHRVEVEGLPSLAKELQARFDRLEMGADQIMALAGEEKAARSRFMALAETARTARLAAASRLDQAVARELLPLKLEAARFRTVVEPLDEGQWTESGMDRAGFEVATNAGSTFGPLARIASGGELSRFILALKVALAERGGAATLVFDEIDRGVGGAVASAIGERLAALARDRQVLVVTHSPQVAARGDAHFRIAKNSDGLVTRTEVRALNREARAEEIARMLSGAQVTDEARAQARRLIEAR